MKSKNLIGLIAFSILAANKISFPVENLESRIEKYKYDINCVMNVGKGEFNYFKKENKYRIRIDAETGDFFNAVFFGKTYLFETTGNISDKDFLPDKYIFKSIDRPNYLIEVIQKFNFGDLYVYSTRSRIFGDKKELIYDKISSIDPETRDIMSVLMELRTKPIQQICNLNVVENGEKQLFSSSYEGVETIKIKNKTYQAHKFKIVDINGAVEERGKEVILYLSADQKRIPLKLVMKDYFISAMTIELTN